MVSDTVRKRGLRLDSRNTSRATTRPTALSAARVRCFAALVLRGLHSIPPSNGGKKRGGRGGGGGGEVQAGIERVGVVRYFSHLVVQAVVL